MTEKFHIMKWFLKKLQWWKHIEVRRISDPTFQTLFNVVLFHQVKQQQLQSSNPLNAFGKKCFSQTDEKMVLHLKFYAE